MKAAMTVGAMKFRKVYCVRNYYAVSADRAHQDQLIQQACKI